MIIRKTFCIFLFSCIFSCSVHSEEENPEDLFNRLFNSYYNKGLAENKEIASPLDDGVGFTVYDKNGSISADYFCQINLLATMGQTLYSFYQKTGEQDWYVQKEAVFYNEPYALEGAESVFTYFKVINGQTYVYNFDTKNYDIRGEIRDYEAVVDIRNIQTLLDLIQQEFVELYPR
jgi:hypothetical protein